MTQAIVDFLESIQIDEQQTKALPHAVSFFNFLLQALAQHTPIRQSG